MSKKRREQRFSAFGQKRRRSRFHQQNQKIDPSLFVRKAVALEPVEEFVPKHLFRDFQINDQLKQNIAAKGYEHPTPIQDQAIPVLLQGKDVVGIANTGTGKTAAFLIPLIEKITKNRNQRALIVTPTRELAIQIQDELRGFARMMHISSVLCIGGVYITNQITDLRKRPQFVIGTPGRLKDLWERKKLQFNDYQSIVLDEVDRMLDMGFIHDIKFIISKLPEQRHSLFFSATMPENVTDVMQSFLKDPVTISVKTQESSMNVDQDILRVNHKDKIDMLHNLLMDAEYKKVLVFGRTKWGIEKLAQNLTKRGVRVTAIHGNKNQNQRSRALQRFKNDEIQALLATDVASRGLDIDNVTHVINFDPPQSYEDYVHRIGRTGRANKKGKALTFVDYD